MLSVELRGIQIMASMDVIPPTTTKKTRFIFVLGVPHINKSLDNFNNTAQLVARLHSAITCSEPCHLQKLRRHKQKYAVTSLRPQTDDDVSAPAEGFAGPPPARSVKISASKPHSASSYTVDNVTQPSRTDEP